MFSLWLFIQDRAPIAFKNIQMTYDNHQRTKNFCENCTAEQAHHMNIYEDENPETPKCESIHK
jgi:hypothetical protein